MNTPERYNIGVTRLKPTRNVNIPRTKLYVWCDGTWCFEEELEELLTFMSDDYREMTGAQEYHEWLTEEKYL